jgi:DNA excision repair protein ERCC-4
VSDYVLAQEICVERKSVSDLFDSLKSGRLLAQAESMSRHYRRPCLLIEFTERGHFGLHAGELPAEVRDKDIISQMATLVLAFPQLRILWSRSIDVTPDIFCAIAAGHDPIDEKKAVEAGQAADSIDPRDRGEDTEAAEAEAAAKAILVSLPGVTTHNIHAVMDLAPTIAQLSRVGEDAMCMAIGAQSGKLLFEFFRSRKPLFLAMNQLR